MCNTKFEYILAANKIAMALYKESKGTLIKSDEVLKDLKEWEDYVSIDERIYEKLYGNLCVKFRTLIKYL